MHDFFSQHTNQLVGFMCPLTTDTLDNNPKNGEIKMTAQTRTDTNSSGPIHLDSNQLEELDKLIKNLKKEVVVTKDNNSEKIPLTYEPENT